MIVDLAMLANLPVVVVPDEVQEKTPAAVSAKTPSRKAPARPAPKRKAKKRAPASRREA